MCFTTYGSVTEITIAIWTIVQTGVHIIWCLFGYLTFLCKNQPSNYWLVIVYLTYFYNHECGDITIESDLFTVRKPKKNAILSNVRNVSFSDEEEEDIYSIVHMIIKNASLPLESSEAARTQFYLSVYIFADGIWIITACLMLIGTCCRVKKFLSTFFYGPWILATGFIIVLDTISSVHFGLDLLQIYNYTSWLRFIGVSNYKDFSKFNDNDSSKYVPQVSSTLVCLLLSRFIIFWIINVYCLFRITNVAILVFRGDEPDVNLNNQKENGRRGYRNPRNQSFNTNTSEARIRNWQLFYGASETFSTMSSTSSDGVNKRSGRNSAKTASSMTPVAQSSQYLDTGYVSPIQDFSAIANNVSSHYTKFSDVAEDIPVPNLRKESIASLQGQLPWTYVKMPEVQGHSEIAKGSSIQRVKKRNEYIPQGVASDETIISTAL